VVRVVPDLDVGGVQQRLLELLPRLLPRFDVSLACLSRGRGALAAEFEAAGIPVEVVPVGHSWSPAALLRLAGHFRGRGARIVHTHTYRPGVSGTVAAWLAGVPVRIAHFHNPSPRPRPGERRLNGLRSCVVCVSEETRADFLARTGYPPERCIVLANGVDLERFVGLPPRADTRRALGVPEAAPLVGVVCRLAPEKNVEGFLDAAARIRAKQPDARFLVVGDGALRGSLEARARGLGLADAVDFTGMRRDVPALLAALDCLVFPTLREGLCGAVIEAMAAGTPVVTSDLACMHLVIRGPHEGELVAGGDPAAFAGAALQLLADPARRRALAAAGRARARAFGVEAAADATAALYEELLGRA
jgi:glycosyltransferase involved in cell wall biosynthesis